MVGRRARMCVGRCSPVARTTSIFDQISMLCSTNSCAEGRNRLIVQRTPHLVELALRHVDVPLVTAAQLDVGEAGLDQRRPIRGG